MKNSENVKEDKGPGLVVLATLILGASVAI